VARRPIREVELWLSPPSSPARMMNILEAEGGGGRGRSPVCFSPPSNWWSPSWVITGEGMQPGCLMKILEAERWLKGTNFHEVAFLYDKAKRLRVSPIRGLGRRKDAMHKGTAKTWLPFKGVTLLLKATLPLASSSHRGLSLLQHAPRSSSYDTGAGPHASCKLARGRRSQTVARAVRATAQQLRVILHFRPDQRVKGRTATQAACNRTKGAHPLDFDASSMEAQAHMSYNRRVGCYMQETAPPLAPLPRLLDCGTSTATRGNPAHDPTVPTRHIVHGPVSRGRRRDGRYGQKWAGRNGGGRRAKAAVKSSAKLMSPPGAAREHSPTA
jgi:hypothetical protein